MTSNRLKGFSDEEIYVIKRAMLDSNVTFSDIYSGKFKETYKNLRLEFMNEDTYRLAIKEGVNI
jgi:hypothetical protein